ncbi:hypothetical protein BT63DRAFT_450092 [Microthyrium microscopicum]|uniref:Uncharacterized protein n=1 Tax=Microthyrium microscopicum TaxID=703497 RepID=A0A6A6US89_9PEZI|nr:hypothetical protein BT63DRAFT_450092 [Microthyrium microscopicum]
MGHKLERTSSKNRMALDYIAPTTELEPVILPTASNLPPLQLNPPKSTLQTLPSIAELDRCLIQDKQKSRTLESQRLLPTPINTSCFSSTGYPTPSNPYYHQLVGTTPSPTDAYSISTRSDSRSVSPGRRHQKYSRSRSPPTPRRTTREDRHAYDLEEQFAMAYMRIMSSTTNSRWSEVVEHCWPSLFPPGQKRRPSAPTPNGTGVPSTYTPRSASALQCRYYRVREGAKMGPVRKGRRAGAGNDELTGLRNMEVELVQAWLKSIGPAELAKNNLTPRANEQNEEYAERAREAYRRNDPFAKTLRSFPQLRQLP